MYYLHLDESGDPRRYRDKNGNLIFRSTRYFTLAGIIVTEETKTEFHKEYKRIVMKYFKGIKLTAKFKLHYNKLRMNIPPFDELTRKQKWELENDVFNAIQNINCKVMSVTINTETHFPRYENNGQRPVHPTAYALYLIRERFQYFLQGKGGTGKVIYESYKAPFRKKMELETKWLLRHENFPHPTAFTSQDPTVEDGDPTKEPMLAFADFFAYLSWSRKTDIKNWEEFYQKYYDPNNYSSYAGNVEID